MLSVSILTVLPVHNASCPYLCSTLYWKSDWATRLSQAKLWANWSPISPHVSFMLDIIPLILTDYDVVDDDHFLHVIPTDSTDSLRSYIYGDNNYSSLSPDAIGWPDMMTLTAQCPLHSNMVQLAISNWPMMTLITFRAPPHNRWDKLQSLIVITLPSVFGRELRRNLEEQFSAVAQSRTTNGRVQI